MPPGGSESHLEVAHRKEESLRFYDVRTSTLTHHDGRGAGLLLVLRDATERKQTERALSLARDQALEASRLKADLLANVSHDLRTPLNAILGYADMLQSAVHGPLADRQSKIAERIIANAMQLGSLVNDLLDQARAEAGHLELLNTAFAPGELAADIELTFGPLAQAKGLALACEVDEDLPAALLGDPRRLRQILVNLVSNAIKFTDQGSVHVGIDRANDKHWTLQVSDTGCGISDQAQRYVFDPFRQMQGTPMRQLGGVGLGLSLVRHLVTLMEGELTLDSREGQGSTFTVILPLKVAT
jgi:two-component system capsular synthesis sensor histidine kinase RcsC